MNDFEIELIKVLSEIVVSLEQLVEQGRILKDSKAITSILKSEEQQFNKESIVQDDDKTLVTQKVTFPTKGKYVWYPLISGGKVRKCNNAPCPYFLKYNEDINTYQHGKYDAEKKEWYHVSDTCEFYDGGG